MTVMTMRAAWIIAYRNANTSSIVKYIRICDTPCYDLDYPGSSRDPKIQASIPKILVSKYSRPQKKSFDLKKTKNSDFDLEKADTHAFIPKISAVP